MKKKGNSQKNTFIAIIILLLLGISVFIILIASMQNKSLSFQSRASCTLESQCILNKGCLNVGEMTKINSLYYCCAISSMTKKPRILIKKIPCLLNTNNPSPSSKPIKAVSPQTQPIIPSTTSVPAQTNENYTLTVNLRCKNYNQSSGNRYISDANRYSYILYSSMFVDPNFDEIPGQEYIVMTNQLMSRTFALPIKSKVGNNFVRAYNFRLAHAFATGRDFTGRTDGITLIEKNPTMNSGIGTQVSWRTSELNSGSYSITYQISDDFCKL